VVCSKVLSLLCAGKMLAFRGVRCAWYWGGSLSAAYVARPAGGVIGVEVRGRWLGC
jgi:hypothetical protein